MKTTAKTEQFGVHLMIDGYHGQFKKLKDAAMLKRLLDTLPAKIGMHKLADSVVIEVGPKNRKDPGGLSGFVLIAESHMSFHTFPSRGFVTIDVYTCQNKLPIKKLVSAFKSAFKFKVCDSYIVKRGLKYPIDNIYE